MEERIEWRIFHLWQGFLAKGEKDVCAYRTGCIDT